MKRFKPLKVALMGLSNIRQMQLLNNVSKFKY